VTPDLEVRETGSVGYNLDIQARLTFKFNDLNRVPTSFLGIARRCKKLGQAHADQAIKPRMQLAATKCPSEF
jgi:hypothetical protein